MAAGSAVQRSHNPSGDFEEPEEPFQDDDLLAAALDDAAGDALEHVDGQKNFLESDFEQELGSPSEEPLAESFGDIASHEIVDVIGSDRAGRVLIIVYAYRLPSNKQFDHDKFLRYLKHTLDQYVDQDYTIVYFHYGLRSHNKPPMKWLVQAYRLLDRRYKKNLKALYLVHPTQFIRIVWNIFKPFISAKFEKKLNYVNYLRELKEVLHTDQLNIPQPVQDHDKQLLEQLRVKPSPSIQTLDAGRKLETQQFGVSLEYVLEHYPNHALPPIVEDTVAYLRKDGLLVEGLFRRSVNLTEVRDIKAKINQGDQMDFAANPNGVHLAAVLLKAFLRELSEPIMTFHMLERILRIDGIPQEQRVAEQRAIISELPEANRRLLRFIFEFLTEVMAKSDVNLMNANNLAVVFGPNLAWPRDQQLSLGQLQHLNNFTYRLLTKFTEIFQ